jgi:hypothetical protein
LTAMGHYCHSLFYIDLIYEHVNNKKIRGAIFKP